MSPAIFALFAAAFAIGTSEFVIAGILPALSSDLSISIPAAGLLVSLYALGVAVGGPLLAAFTGKAKADRLVGALQAAGIPVLRQDFSRGGGLLRVIFAGPLGSGAEAQAQLGRIRDMGYPDAFVWTQD